MSFISPVPTDPNGNPRQTGAQQSLGKNDFLQLLVTKLEYQDPLKPMEDEDFIAQLAQFSSLEQMNNISEGIEASNQWNVLQMQSMNNVMAAGFIGKDVEAEFSGAYLDVNNEPKLSFTTNRYAEEITFTITDAEGNVVRRLSMDDVSAGTNSIKWDGKDDRGNRLQEGYYNFSASATTPDGEKFSPKMALVGQVETVVYRDGQAFLIVDGTEVSLGDVSKIGQPGTLTGEDD